MKTKYKLGMTEQEVRAYLSKRFCKKFSDWIGGQTCPVLPNGKVGYYAHDVIRFVELFLNQKPTYFD